MAHLAPSSSSAVDPFHAFRSPEDQQRIQQAVDYASNLSADIAQWNEKEQKKQAAADKRTGNSGCDVSSTDDKETQIRMRDWRQAMSTVFTGESAPFYHHMANVILDALEYKDFALALGALSWSPSNPATLNAQSWIGLIANIRIYYGSILNAYQTEQKISGRLLAEWQQAAKGKANAALNRPALVSSSSSSSPSPPQRPPTRSRLPKPDHGRVSPKLLSLLKLKTDGSWKQPRRAMGNFWLDHYTWWHQATPFERQVEIEEVNVIRLRVNRERRRHLKQTAQQRAAAKAAAHAVAVARMRAKRRRDAAEAAEEAKYSESGESELEDESPEEEDEDIEDEQEQKQPTPTKKQKTKELPILEPKKDLPEDQACKTCFERPSHILLAPCGHTGLCSGCSLKLSLCPFCRAKIEGRHHVIPQ